MMRKNVETLDLSKNYFFSLGVFPQMEKLQSLILDDCNIMSVEKDALKNLLNLKALSIQRNRFTTLPSNIMIPSLQSLSFNGQKPDGKTPISIGKTENICKYKHMLAKKK